MTTTPEASAMAEVKAVAWVERTEEGLTRMWSADLAMWANRPANPEPLYDQRAVDELRAEVSGLCLRIESLRLRKETAIQLAVENLQRAERAEAQVAELTTQRDYFESERDRLVIQGGDLAKLCDDQADRLAEVEIACAQAVEFAEYVAGAAKGSMVERARHYLSLPYSQELAARLNTYADDAREGR